jgi:hypothetical protein
MDTGLHTRSGDLTEKCGECVFNHDIKSTVYEEASYFLMVMKQETVEKFIQDKSLERKYETKITFTKKFFIY